MQSVKKKFVKPENTEENSSNLKGQFDWILSTCSFIRSAINFSTSVSVFMPSSSSN